MLLYKKYYIKLFAYINIGVIVEMVVIEEEGVTSTMMSQIYVYISMDVK